ncbi:DUF4105 domain-containing protein [Myxococcota bacterium]|nr:DUF4105 domain-containing protein [Myxococcota bacterium]
MTLALTTVALLAATQVPAPSTTTSTTARAPRIELVTMGRGGYLYSYWGHAALRVTDPRDGSDRAYNFGGVELGDGMIGVIRDGIVRGYVYETSFSELLATYAGEDRTITLQGLALDPVQSTRLAERLRALVAGERSHYAYHHFDDNCTTRIAEELDRVLDGHLRAMGRAPAAGTWRTRALRPMHEHPWLYVGLDLAYTSVTDRPVTLWDTAFLPSGLAAFLGTASVGGARLASGARDVFRSIGFADETRWAWPWVRLYVLFTFPLCVVALVRPRLAARIHGLVLGLTGLALAALWIVSPYDFFRGNWNLLVLPPTHLALVAGWGSERGARLRDRYLVAHLGLLGLLAAASSAGVIVQAIGPALGLALPPAAVLAWHGVKRAWNKSG